MFLHENRAALRHQRCDYPALYLAKNPPKHQFLVSSLLSNDLSQLQAVLASVECERAIISTEGLTNHLYDFPGEALHAFRTLTRSCQVTVFIVTRSPSPWLRSYYKQAVINPRVTLVDYYATALTLPQFAEHRRVLRLVDHDTVTRDVASAFGAREVVAAKFEEDWMSTFCSSFGLSFEHPARLKTINQSPPNWAVELMRQVNAHDPPESQRRAWRAVLHKILESKHTLLASSVDGVPPGGELDLDPCVLGALRPREDEEFALSWDDIRRVREVAHRKSSLPRPVEQEPRTRMRRDEP